MSVGALNPAASLLLRAGSQKTPPAQTPAAAETAGGSHAGFAGCAIANLSVATRSSLLAAQEAEGKT